MTYNRSTKRLFIGRININPLRDRRRQFQFVLPLELLKLIQIIVKYIFEGVPGTVTKWHYVKIIFFYYDLKKSNNNIWVPFNSLQLYTLWKSMDKYKQYMYEAYEVKEYKNILKSVKYSVPNTWFLLWKF